MFAIEGNLKQPRFPGVSLPATDFWRGYDRDAGRAAFVRGQTPTITVGTCYHIAYKITHGEGEQPEDISAGTLAPVFRDCNGYGYFTDGEFTLARTPSREWTLSTFPAHIQPREWSITSADREYNPSAEKYEWHLSAIPAGDCFFTGAVPAVGGPGTAWIPRGAERAPELSAQCVLSAFWPRWEGRTSGAEGETLAGVYLTALDGAEGTAVFGFPGTSSGTSAEYYEGNRTELGEMGEIALCL